MNESWPEAYTTFALAAAAVLLAGCSIGPKYVKPSTPAVPAYKELGASNVVEGSWKAGSTQRSAPRAESGGRGFHDPELNRLEEQLNISNQNIAAAAANVQAARAMIREARAQYFPPLTANPGITNSRLSTAFGQTIGANFHHLLAAARRLLGARSVGPRSKHSEGQHFRGAGQRRRSGKRSPLRRKPISPPITTSCARRMR